MTFLRPAPFTFAALAALAACTPYRAPFTTTSAASARPQAAPHEATLVLLWPPTNCDPAGYFTIATSSGRFVGNIARGSQLVAHLPAGDSALIAWNDVVESSSGSLGQQTVAVLHADLRAGGTYYARMAFGEWDDRGPANLGASTPIIFLRGSAYRHVSNRCIAYPETTTSAMVAVPPRSDRSELAEWTATLEPTVPDGAAGQAWLDTNHTAFESHRALAEERYARLRPKGKELATIGPDDAMGK